MSHSASLAVLKICPSLLDAAWGYLLLGPDSLLKIRTVPAWSRLFYHFLHLEVSSRTWVEQTGVTFLRSYDTFRAYKFGLNVGTFLWHIFYLFCENLIQNFIIQTSLGLQSCSTISPSPLQPYLRLELPWPLSALECPSRDHSFTMAGLMAGQICQFQRMDKISLDIFNWNLTLFSDWGWCVSWVALVWIRWCRKQVMFFSVEKHLLGEVLLLLFPRLSCYFSLGMQHDSTRAVSITQILHINLQYFLGNTT